MNRFFLGFFFCCDIFSLVLEEWKKMRGRNWKKYDTQRIYWSRHSSTHTQCTLMWTHIFSIHTETRKRRQWMVAEERRDIKHSESYLISRCLPTWSPITYIEHAICTSNCDRPFAVVVVVSNSECRDSLDRTPNNISPIEFLFKYEKKHCIIN